MWAVLRFKRCPRFSYRSLQTLPKDVKATMPGTYDAGSVEAGWYHWWESNNFFRNSGKDVDGDVSEKFSLVLPPPNITGTLHLGHALTCAIQDSLVSWNRMKGKDVVWFPGCDHAGIATQVIVEKKLKAQGISREDLGRQKFLEEVWQWKKEKQDTIYQQLKALGATLQWEKSVFTMDPNMSYAVSEAFVRLHNAGKIYRKESLVNWSCQLQSAISDVEVEHREMDGPTLISVPGYEQPILFGQIYQFGYRLSEDNRTQIMVSTTRPETIIGDTAVAVHPDDDRYAKYIGKTVRHPIRHDEIPVIADLKVDKLFGTGALKVTPGHDLRDFEIADRHGLKLLNIFDNRGIANENCGIYQGLPRFKLRENMINFLSENGLLSQVSPHAMSVPVCSRSGDIVEPLLRPQWFVRTAEMAIRAKDAVEKGHLKIYPAHFEKTWFEWLDNIRDWCISRQLWWGHQIPAYRPIGLHDGPWIAAHSAEQAMEYARMRGIHSSGMHRDDDVLDTWFSSSLFPFAVCGWPQKTADLHKYFPLSLMETGHDILFFWVARMVMLSLELTDKLPFKEVVLHGIICDSQGRKMSKSLGNVIDPMDLIHGASLQSLEAGLETSRQSGHISAEEFMKAKSEKQKLFPDGVPQCGADALRLTLCSYNVKNHFINLDVDLLKRNRSFCNKIWQATRFMFLLLDRVPTPEAPIQLNSIEQNSCSLLRINCWIMSCLHDMVQRVNGGLDRYDFHHATDALYSFLYGQLCNVYLEAIKPLTGGDQRQSSLILAQCFDVSFRCLAPFMPFLSEELYQRLHSKLASRLIQAQRAESVLIAEFPESEKFTHWKNEQLSRDMEQLLLAVAELRGIKLQYSMKSKPEVVFVTSSESIRSQSYVDQYSTIISTLAGVGQVEISAVAPSAKSGATLISRTMNNCSVHLDMTGLIDRDEEFKKCIKKLKKLTDKLSSLERTINNPSYVHTAPAHVQENHKAKAVALRHEISQLEEYVQFIKRDLQSSQIQ